MSKIETEFDILIVGSGAAGLYSALSLPSILKIAIITKDTLTLSASDWAQGGIAAVIAPQDSFDSHIADTLKAGAGLCELPSVQFLVQQAPKAIASLVDLGVAFDRHQDQLALTLEAAHSHPRILHAADTTGKEVVTTLKTQVLTRPNITVLSHAFVLNLWMENDICQGLALLYQDQITWIRASAVILATGGSAQVYQKSTNPKISTGDGVAIAWRAGAILRDLEFFQFHPTALTKPSAPHFLISEAVRGEGAHLIDTQNRRFAFDYHPKGELAPRDIVSRAIFQHLQQNPTDQSVFLDLRPIPIERIKHRFPNIIKICQQWGIDLFTQPIPVAPAAHYWMGGILTDLNNSTTIKGLYAIGETACTGVHGANRLASNSLLECIVFGFQLTQIVPNLPPLPPRSHKSNYLSVPSFSSHEIQLIIELRNQLPQLMWNSAGIIREQQKLDQAITQLEKWKEQLMKLPISQIISNLSPDTQYQLTPQQNQYWYKWMELLNLLDIGQLILKSAAFRQESRGGHYRLDYRETSANWKCHTLIKHDQLTKSSPIKDH